MKETTSPSKSAIQFGVFFGIIMILEFVISYVMDIDSKETPSVGIIINVLNLMVLPVILIGIGCNNFKKNYNGGFISFAQCLKIGVSITVIGALIFGLFNVAFNLVFPEFVEETIRKTKEIMIESNPSMTSEQLEQAIEMTKKSMNPTILIPSTMAVYAAIGLLCSLIIGAFIKNDKPTGY